MKQIKNYINGNLLSHSDLYDNIYNPSTGEVIGQVVLSNNKDLDDAIETTLNETKTND